MVLNLQLPSRQISYNAFTRDDTASLVFEVYDRETNQVLMFDIFLDYRFSHLPSPFGALTIMGRPYGWMNLEKTWKQQDLILHFLYF